MANVLCCCYLSCDVEIMLCVDKVDIIDLYLDFIVFYYILLQLLFVCETCNNRIRDKNEKRNLLPICPQILK